MKPPPEQPGKVYLVGAGPGDPRLISLRGVECLGRADVVLYDYLVNPLILAHAPAEAELVCLGHIHTGRVMEQAEVERRLIEAASQGRTVVRLKSGDPSIFGREAEEASALRTAGIAHEIVPGITAAVAAAAYAEVPLTHGERSSAVTLVTGQQRIDKAGPPLEYEPFARLPGTLVFYMGVTTATQWSDTLLAAGRAPTTPVLIVRRASWSDQSIVPTTLGEVASVIRQRAIRPPAVVLVGDVAGLAPKQSWSSVRPLAGCRVLVTRPRHQANALVAPLLEAGADVVCQPAITIGPPPSWQPVDASIARLHSFDWLVFSSTNGVESYLGRLCQQGDLRQLAHVKLAAIGPGTAEELARWHLRADLVPEQYRAEALAECLASAAAGQRLLLVRASRGRETLAERLTATAASVEQVVAYESRDIAEPDPTVVHQLEAGAIGWITVTSSAIARSLAHLLGDKLRTAKLVSISPVTTQTLEELGHRPAAEATEYTMPGVVEAIVRAQKSEHA